MCWMNARDISHTPRRSILCRRSYSASVALCADLLSPMPALFTKPDKGDRFRLQYREHAFNFCRIRDITSEGKRILILLGSRFGAVLRNIIDDEPATASMPPVPQIMAISPDIRHVPWALSRQCPRGKSGQVRNARIVLRLQMSQQHGLIPCNFC